MFKRVMVAVVGVPFLILVLGWAPAWATMVLLTGMCAVGAWELMHAVAGEAGKPLIPLTVLAAALVPVCVYLEMSVETAELTALPELPLTGILGAVFVFLVFVLAIHRYDGDKGIPFAAVTAAIFGALVFPLMLSCLLRLRMVPAIGMLLVFFPPSAPTPVPSLPECSSASTSWPPGSAPRRRWRAPWAASSAASSAW